MTVYDGVYKIINAKAPTSFLTMDTSLARQPTHVFGYPWCNKDTQKWCIKSKKGCGGHTIQNVGTDKYLAISGHASDNHDVFGMSACSSWAIKDVGKGRFRLFIEGTPFNLDLAGYGDPTPGTRVSLWGKNESNVNQCWKLEKVTSPPKPQALTHASIQSGVYMILNVHDSNALDLSQSDYRSIITWPLHGNTNQRWHIEQLGEGYSIRSVSSGKYLTAEEGICDGAAIVANGFPVSWEISNLPGGRDLDMYIRWPSQRIAVSLVTPATTQGQNKVGLQGFNWDSKWQGWRLIPVECPSVGSTTGISSGSAKLQNVNVTSGIQALQGTLNTNVSCTPEDRSMTESATVTVTEDDYSITTTRTTVTSAVVSSVVPK